ncbi:MAG: preprotein translocase subunit SecA [Patescibacteria group bacterium]|nr:preprotein translocase subunit SecA [Patescibacteria group bacterium]
MSWITKLLGDPNAKVVAKLREEVANINGLEPAIAALSDEQLRAKTAEFKQRLADGAQIDDLAHEAFAVVREASRRILGQRHYDVQLMGGLVLHKTGIAEMRTGEGKTLTGTSPVYLNALAGKGVHVITVNDYLAKRDAVWMGRVFHFLGLSVGCIQHESGYRYDENYKAPVIEATTTPETQDEVKATTQSFRVEMDNLRPASRKEAYDADITYGTNNEFGFDYLRDNMVQSPEQLVQRGLYYAIVDEVDSILIDEARTPLIISTAAEESADLYYKFADIAKTFIENEDYNLDEKMRVSTFTEAGLQKVEKALGVANLYEQGLQMVHHAEQSLRAQSLFKKDRDYVVRNGEVVIVDEFTGRMMEGRRYSEGLHQAIEAKEGVKIQRESKTMATITFQNYFRLYTKLAGMTGTAATEAEEFEKIYKLEVTQIPTHRENKRTDLPDRIYRTEKGKWLSVVQEVKERHEKGQPVLIGTVSIEKNELLGELLRAAGVPYKMLNAKNHEQEAEIIAQAGKRGAVTLATNMAGRGVDIIMGGNPPSPEEAELTRGLGGLHVIGTERHESRRIDNQLRGRAGRQGDPGSTQFFVSLDDDLMRIFATTRVKQMMSSLGIEETMPIESRMVTNALEKAQHRVEGHNFDTRKHVLEYDDVLNKHRLSTYAERRSLMTNEHEDAHAEILRLLEGEIERIVYFHTTKDSHDVPAEFAAGDAKSGDWDPKEITESFNTILKLNPEDEDSIKTTLATLSRDKEALATQRTKVIETMLAAIKSRYADKAEKINDPKLIAKLERTVLLRAVDAMWMRHLDDMTYLRRTIGLQGYAQRDPLVEYKKESFRLYTAMREEIAREVVYNIFKILDQAANAQVVINAAPNMMSALGKMLGISQNGTNGSGAEDAKPQSKLGG